MLQSVQLMLLGRAPSDSGRGATTLFLAVIILPLLFFFFTLALDISAYLTEMARMQRILDEAGMFSSRFLPDDKEVEQAAKEYLAAHTARAGNVTVLSDGDAVALTLESSTRLFFAELLGLKAGIPMALHSRVRHTPLDMMIAIDAGPQVAPHPVSGSPWGSEADWGIADLFQQSYFPPAGFANLRLATQQCFNPVFSPLKLAAIELFQGSAAFTGNAVGLTFFPGVSEVDLLRQVALRQSGGSSEGAFFPAYSALYSNGVWCAAAAQEESSKAHYRVPYGGGENPLVELPSFALRGEALPQLSVREAVWARAASSERHTCGGRVIDDIWRQLLVAEVLGSRGGVATRVVKHGIVLSVDLPRSAAGRRYPDSGIITALRERFADIRSEVLAHGVTMKLTYVIFDTREINGSELGDIVGFRAFLEAERQIPEEGRAGSLELRVLTAKSAEELGQVVQMLMEGERTSLISR